MNLHQQLWPPEATWSWPSGCLSLTSSARASRGEIAKVQWRGRWRGGSCLGNRLIGFQGLLITREGFFIFFVHWFLILLILLINRLLILFIFVIHWFFVSRQFWFFITWKLRLLISRQVIRESFPRANCLCSNSLSRQLLAVALAVAVPEHSGLPRGLERGAVERK